MVKQQSKRKWKKPLKILLLIILFIILSVVVYAGVILSQDYSIDEMAMDVDNNSIVYDREGNEIRSIYSVQNREVVSLDTLSELTKDAFIYTEDRRFESHHGVDPIGILRAIKE